MYQTSLKLKRIAIASVIVSFLIFGWIFFAAVMDGAAGLAILAGIGFVATVALGAAGIRYPDELRSHSTQDVLSMASETLDAMAQGFSNEACERVCRLLLPRTTAVAVAMTDREHVLAYVGRNEESFPVNSDIATQISHQVIATGQPRIFTSIDPSQISLLDDQDTARRLRFVQYTPAGIVVPLTVGERVVGTLKFYYPSDKAINRTQRAVAMGLGRLISTQLSSTERDAQARLAAQAELKALQAQINPHFLFNTINTIAALIRTDAMRARDLLREFAFFYRETLDTSDSLIPLARELEQTRRYLIFEYARFGEERIKERERVQEGCEGVRVPGFIIQPIVENSVRHAMREEGTLTIAIDVTTEGDDVLIAVADDGVGMEADLVQSLMAGTYISGHSKGAGIALSNVAERLQHIYGSASGLEIVSRPDAGTVVTLRLEGAAAGIP